jgi:hypothetical protein
MTTFLRRWLSISFLNLVFVACLGVTLRYKIAFYLPLVQQKFVLHSHSHFAFAGWITQTLMVLLIYNLSLKKGAQVFKKYKWLLYANCITAYGMLVSFIFQGYGFFSITFSTLSIFVSYFFCVYYWKDLSAKNEKIISNWWIKAALLFNVISSVGAFGLAFMMANKIVHQNWYLAAIYFYLHFQYNGWFLFAGMGLLVAKLEQGYVSPKKMKTAFLLFAVACVPAYFLSSLWLPIPGIIYIIVVGAVIAQMVGWLIMVKEFIRVRPFIICNFLKYGRVLLLLAAVAFSIKLLLQAGSVHPALSQLSYGFRPIVIGYLHLVLLAVTSLFLIGYIVAFQLIPVTKNLKSGVFIFVAGIIINELLLMLQGVTGLAYISIAGIDLYLLIAALILLSGAGIMLMAVVKIKEVETGVINGSSVS